MTISKAQLEADLGKKLPFDEQILDYLLKVAPASDNKELLDLVEDFCPKWLKHDRASLAAKLKSESERGCADAPSDPPMPSSSSSFGGLGHSAKFTSGAGDLGGNNKAGDLLAADMLLAQMLQEEEDAQATINHQPQGTNSKKGKKASYKPLNINYQVARSAGGGGGAALATAAPSSLADMLRNRRSQEMRASGLSSEHFGPAAQRENGPVRLPSVWAGGQDGMTWAERATLAAEKAAEEEPAVDLKSGQQTSGTARALRLRVRTVSGIEYMVDAELDDTIGDVKLRLEKMHNIAFRQQRLLHAGKELQDPQDLRSIKFIGGQYTLQLALRTDANPKPRAAPTHVDTLDLRLQLPGGSSAVMSGLPADISGTALKQRIQQDHGIRAEHIGLSFFSQPLSDFQALADQGVASGALVAVSLRPPVAASAAREEMPVGKKSRKQQQDQLAGMQTSGHGRVIDEAEAMRLALEASLGSGTSSTGFGRDLDDDNDDPEDPSLAPEVASDHVEFLTDVAAQENRFAVLVNQAKSIASALSYKDVISRVSKRSGYRLTVVTEKGKKKAVLGFMVYRFRQRAMVVIQVALAEKHRGSGLGRLMIRWLAQHGKNPTNNCDAIQLCSPTGGVGFYEKFGFQRYSKEAPEGEDAFAGHVYLEYTFKKNRGGASSINKVSSKNKNPWYALSREDLIRAVFAACDADRDGVLNLKEMGRFAMETGFDGGDDAWATEFEALCQDNGKDPLQGGVDAVLFAKLVDDQSDEGIYCTDSELKEMLAKFGPAPAAPSGSMGAAANRVQLISDVFKALDVDGDGHLSSAEMRPFALHTGFDGSDVDWLEEFRSLCSEAGSSRGMALPHFKRLVDDTSDNGCYCSDEELRDLLNKSKKSQKSQPPNFPPPPAPAQNKDLDSRAQLVESVFHALDTNKDGQLSANEMRPFATHTGFDGSDHDWAEEFKALCAEGGSAHSVNLAHFRRLVDDSSDNGCYCSNDELESIRGKLPPVQVSLAKAPVVADDRSQPPVAQDADNRRELLRAVFNGLDTDCDGCLSAKEMRPFATHTGFDGSDQDWADEFELLCAESGSAQGVNLMHFEKLVNDSSDDGCYCTSDELKSLLGKLPRQPPATAKPSGPRPPPPAPTESGDARKPSQLGQPPATAKPSEPEPRPPPLAPTDSGDSQKRTELIREVFGALDGDKDGHLTAVEMKPFAIHTGFAGSDQDWADEFKELCAESGAAPKGVSLAQFENLVNDDSDNGCYCAFDELQSMLDKLPKPSNQPAVQPAVTAQVPAVVDARSRRQGVVRQIFLLLDKNEDGRLSAQEMRPFAVHTGFDGNEQDWTEEFGLLCRESGSSSEGVSLEVFERIVDDDSENGCHCSDDELESLLDQLSKQQPSVEISAVTLPPRPVAANSSKALDADKDGQLSVLEMRPFANRAGFAGSNEDWVAEFNMLCAEGGSAQGVSMHHFLRLVDDMSDDGLYCSSDDLTSLLLALTTQAQPAKEAETTPLLPAASVPDIDIGRNTLVRKLFAALDKDKDGHLSALEMKVFADHTGFDGSAEAWAEEFNALCVESGAAQGVSLVHFERLVDDSSDSGCYCSNDEMNALLEKLTKLPHPAHDLETAMLSPTVPQQEVAETTRQKLVQEVFKALDKNKHCFLTAQDMRPFANHTGFDGSDQEWAEEFAMLCAEGSSLQGVTLEDFQRLVDDTSDNGCHCSEDELQSLLSKLLKSSTSWQSPPGLPRPPPGLPPPMNLAPADGLTSTSPSIGQEEYGGSSPSRPRVPRGGMRATLAKALFRALDADGDGYLNQQEMRELARRQGFGGSDAEWEVEYKTLCAEHGVPTDPGVDAALLAKLLDDQSDSGCYSSDDELRSLVRELLPAVASRQRPRGQRSRAELIKAVFQRLGATENGMLSPEKMRVFAEFYGFQGTDAEWSHEYAALFEVAGIKRSSTSMGVSLGHFTQLVNNHSEHGCYCTDAELAQMLDRLEPASRHPLVNAIFLILDRDGDGQLGRNDLSFFAGLDGLGAEAGRFLGALRKTAASVSVEKETFQKLVDGKLESVDLSPATTDELRGLLAQLQERAAGQDEDGADGPDELYLPQHADMAQEHRRPAVRHQPEPAEDPSATGRVWRPNIEAHGGSNGSASRSRAGRATQNDDWWTSAWEEESWTETGNDWDESEWRQDGWKKGRQDWEAHGNWEGRHDWGGHDEWGGKDRTGWHSDGGHPDSWSAADWDSAQNHSDSWSKGKGKGRGKHRQGKKGKGH
eukprot:TRINITY_DN8233_c0_g1_i1.p1 TRINITY_DN8233_c0_g1~~TRINITY_DN8233_c0_g1_i1.p1  ORF type:complete len:2246 (+),score=491.91 TRINITY_DN8233_c0_g1_i1:182-6919(+)